MVTPEITETPRETPHPSSLLRRTPVPARRPARRRGACWTQGSWKLAETLEKTSQGEAADQPPARPGWACVCVPLHLTDTGQMPFPWVCSSGKAPEFLPVESRVSETLFSPLGRPWAAAPSANTTATAMVLTSRSNDSLQRWDGPSATQSLHIGQEKAASTGPRVPPRVLRQLDIRSASFHRWGIRKDFFCLDFGKIHKT